MKRPNNSSAGTTGTSLIEWIAAGLGAAILCSMLGYMAYEGLGEVEGFPKVEFTTAAPERHGRSFLLRFDATNSGEVTATSLIVRATLTDGEKEVEARELTIDYLPKQSRRSGGFFFLRDPSSYKVTISATAYLDP